MHINQFVGRLIYTTFWWLLLIVTWQSLEILIEGQVTPRIVDDIIAFLILPFIWRSTNTITIDRCENITKHTPIILLTWLIIFIIFNFTGCNSTQYINKKVNQPTTSEITDYEKATVTQIIDGDTIIAEINGNYHKIRLIGIDAPESVNPDESKNTPEGEDASDFLKTTIRDGDAIWLESDISDTDRYERLLRYVYITEPIDNPDEEWLSTYMLNAIIVKNGHAVAKEYPPDTKYAWLFKTLE